MAPKPKWSETDAKGLTWIYNYVKSLPGYADARKEDFMYKHNYSTGEPHMSFHICCTYPLIYMMQLSTPSCPEHLTNHSPHTMEKENRKGE